MELRRKAGGKYLPSHTSAHQMGNSWVSQMLHLPCWKWSPKAAPCTHSAGSQPTWPSGSISLCCLAGSGRRSQLPWLHLQPNPVDACRSQPQEFLPVGIQAQCCGSRHSCTLIHPFHEPCSPAITAGRQRVALPTAILAEITELIVKVAA